jgi:hypothetical protein
MQVSSLVVQNGVGSQPSLMLIASDYQRGIYPRLTLLTVHRPRRGKHLILARKTADLIGIVRCLDMRPADHAVLVDQEVPLG